jgi:hypothetical protein
VSSSPAACTNVRPQLPELALGTLTGEERARTLEHVATCPACRQELAWLSDVGDELLRLAPTAQPPVGFETRALERLLGGGRGVGAWRRRWLAVAAAALVAAILGGSAVYLAGSDDRAVADAYRDTLAIADGEYFAARALRDDAGGQVGHVFGYQGSPSWIFCVVRAGRGGGSYAIEVTVKGGKTWTAGEMEVSEGREATWAHALDVDLHDVERFTFVERRSGESFVARW